VKAQPVEFKSSLSLSESVRRLGERVRDGGPERGRPAMGRVSAEEVRLYWYPSMDFVKSFSPVFHGRFQEVSGQVFLRGQFEYSSLGTGQNVLSFIFLIIVACSVLLPLLGRVTDRHTRRLEIAIPFAATVLSLGPMIWYHIWVKRTWQSETKALTGLIQGALNESDSEKSGKIGG
jgi:hypothetical protein